MNFATAIDFASLMPEVAARLLGEPNQRLSKPPKELRYGTHGSLSVNLSDGTFYDHEAGHGGSPPSWHRCGERSGLSIPKSPSPDPRRCSPISRATLIASPSPTAD